MPGSSPPISTASSRRPGYTTSEELAANLGIDTLRLATTVHMGGASPIASLQHAALAVAVGSRRATCSSSSAGTATPRSGPAKEYRDRAAGMDASAVGDVVLDYYLPYGARSAAQFYSWIAMRHKHALRHARHRHRRDRGDVPRATRS